MATHTHWSPNAYVEAERDREFVNIVGRLTDLGNLSVKIVTLCDGWTGEFDMAYEFPVHSPHTNL